MIKNVCLGSHIVLIMKLHSVLLIGIVVKNRNNRLGGKNNDSPLKKWVIVNFTLPNIKSGTIPNNKTIASYGWVHLPF